MSSIHDSDILLDEDMTASEQMFMAEGGKYSTKKIGNEVARVGRINRKNSKRIKDVRAALMGDELSGNNGIVKDIKVLDRKVDKILFAIQKDPASVLHDDGSFIDQFKGALIFGGWAIAIALAALALLK